MAYIALYRKYRPLKFEEMVGQEHIVKTLKNQIQNKRIGHAYLFSGGRGSGKTTTAKILARAVNCLNLKDGEPCNECETCKASLEGNLIDITEMDAASNNGVDNIREIREEVEYIPTSSKYRVYIIDEVHMLSPGAFNALLKTLEEPPEHVIFILATTEPQKLPATILSRCQRYDFKRITEEDIVKRLKIICESNKTQIEDEALYVIARLADGAMRDAISVLERCIEDGSEKITAEKIRNIAGVPNSDYLIEICEKLSEKNIDGILEATQKIISEGKDISVFTWELIKKLRDILIYNVAGTLKNISESEELKIKEASRKISKEKLINLIEKLSSLQASLKWSTQANIIFETGLIKICMEEQTTNTQSENLVENKNVKTSIVKEETIKNKVLTKIKEKGKMALVAKLNDTKIEIGEDGILQIIFEKPVDSFTREIMQSSETKQLIKEVVTIVLEKEIGVKYVNLK